METIHLSLFLQHFPYSALFYFFIPRSYAFFVLYLLVHASRIRVCLVMISGVTDRNTTLSENLSGGAIFLLSLICLSESPPQLTPPSMHKQSITARDMVTTTIRHHITITWTLGMDLQIYHCPATCIVLLHHCACPLSRPACSGIAVRNTAVSPPVFLSGSRGSPWVSGSWAIPRLSV